MYARRIFGQLIGKYINEIIYNGKLITTRHSHILKNSPRGEVHNES